MEIQTAVPFRSLHLETPESTFNLLMQKQTGEHHSVAGGSYNICAKHIPNTQDKILSGSWSIFMECVCQKCFQALKVACKVDGCCRDACSLSCVRGLIVFIWTPGNAVRQGQGCNSWVCLCARACAYARLTLTLSERCCGALGFVVIRPQGQNSWKGLF